jgi:protein-tyrosine phosphatase
MLFRSGALHKLTDEDNKKLNQLNIKLICDLRTPRERKGKLDKLTKNTNTRIVNTPIYHLENKIDPGRIGKLIWFITTAIKKFDYIQFMKEYYSRIALNHLSEISKVITLLADQNNIPALIHCSGGKDRTGWLSAVLQLLSGMSIDLVYEDFLCTNKHLNIKMYSSKTSMLLFKLINKHVHNLQPLIEVRIEYLQFALDLVFLKYGTIEQYLHKGCKIPINIINRLQRILTE